ncbi:MAG: hypothetical protein AAGG79_01325 [Pseudomonadota bacterium]
MARHLTFASLFFFVAASAIFRLSGEHAVGQQEAALTRMASYEEHLSAEIDRLRFEVEVLESAPRLKEVGDSRLGLAPGNARQLADGRRLRDVIDPAARLEYRR